MTVCLGPTLEKPRRDRLGEGLATELARLELLLGSPLVCHQGDMLAAAAACPLAFDEGQTITPEQIEVDQDYLGAWSAGCL